MKSIAQVLEQKDDEYQILFQILAGLRTASHIHQTHHWQTRGPKFYGDHLLFQRLYNDGQGHIDSLAEKSIGLGNVNLVDALEQSSTIHHMCQSLCQEMEGNSADEMVLKSLAAERKVLDLIKEALSYLTERDLLTPGLSNLLEDIADKREEFVYLLKQRAQE